MHVSGTSRACPPANVLAPGVLLCRNANVMKEHGVPLSGASLGHRLADVAACALAAGTLPASWSNMVRLKTLDLSDNRLTGAPQLKQCDAAPST